MAKSLSKVTKKVAKKKGSAKALHENSRDAKKIRKASARDDRISRLAATRIKLSQPYRKFLSICYSVSTKLPNTDPVQRVAFFRDMAKGSTGAFDSEEIQRLIARYGF